MIQLKLKPSPRTNSTHNFSTPTMARRGGAPPPQEDDFLEIGDMVEVPGGMDGIVKFVGEVRGKQGYFVGVELSRNYAHRGKNDGDAEGIRYFSTAIPGAGIFLPIARATKIYSPPTSAGDIPPTPTTPSIDQMYDDHEDMLSPTPAVKSKQFSQSMRAPSPAFRAKSRPSLPRPESPLRRTQAAPSTATPDGRQSLNMLQSNRLGASRVTASPSPAKFGGSVRGPPKARPTVGSTPGRPTSSAAAVRRGINDESSELAALQAMITEKNAKIASLTAEFDAHRADFRSTLDTLELASTETERVYEKKVEDLLQERQLLLAQSEDVESVAQQLRQLEEVVQELEEGLEDARRGEAEARGEVEFLRGEVERVRAELRRERERNVELVREVDEARRNRPRAKTAIRTPSRSNGALDESSQTLRATSPAPSNDVGVVSSPKLARSSLPLADKERTVSPTPKAEPNQSLEVKHDLIADSPTSAQPATMKPVPHSAPEPVKENDTTKWCALCEQDGHDSINCPNDKF